MLKNIAIVLLLCYPLDGRHIPRWRNGKPDLNDYSKDIEFAAMEKRAKVTGELQVNGTKFENMGCWRDAWARALPSLEGEHPLLMDPNYKLRTHALMKCARAALDKHMKMFGLENGGQCFGSADADVVHAIDRYGIGHDCKESGKGGPWSLQTYRFTFYPSKTAVDGDFSSWSGWTTCSKTCGDGTRRRLRTCSNPAPSYGGNDCAGLGSSVESKSCSVTPCKANVPTPDVNPLMDEPTDAPFPTTRPTKPSTAKPAEKATIRPQMPQMPPPVSPHHVRAKQTGAGAPDKQAVKAGTVVSKGKEDETKTSNPHGHSQKNKAVAESKATSKAHSESHDTSSHEESNEDIGEFGVDPSIVEDTYNGGPVIPSSAVEMNTPLGPVVQGEMSPLKMVVEAQQPDNSSSHDDECFCPSKVCSANADLAFVIDGSSDIPQMYFAHVLDYLKALARGFNASQTQVSLVAYGDDATAAFSFGSVKTTHEIDDGIDAVSYMGGEPKTGNALFKANKNLFESSRPGVSHALILLTSGSSSDDVGPPALELRKAGVKVTAIGLGKLANVKELIDIASEPKASHVFTAFLDTLPERMDEIVKGVCSDVKGNLRDRKEACHCTETRPDETGKQDKGQSTSETKEPLTTDQEVPKTSSKPSDNSTSKGDKVGAPSETMTKNNRSSNEKQHSTEVVKVSTSDSKTPPIDNVDKQQSQATSSQQESQSFGVKTQQQSPEKGIKPDESGKGLNQSQTAAGNHEPAGSDEKPSDSKPTNASGQSVEGPAPHHKTGSDVRPSDSKPVISEKTGEAPATLQPTGGSGERPSDSKPTSTGGQVGEGPAAHQRTGYDERPSDTKPSVAGVKTGEAAPVTQVTQPAEIGEKPSDTKPIASSEKTGETPATHKPSGSNEKPSDTKPSDASGKAGKAPPINETAGNGEKPSDSKPSGTGGHEGAAPATHQSAGSEESLADSKPAGAGVKAGEAPTTHQSSGTDEKSSDTKPTIAGAKTEEAPTTHQSSGTDEKPSDTKPTIAGAKTEEAPTTHQSSGTDEKPSDTKPTVAGAKTEEAPTTHKPAENEERPSDSRPTVAGGQEKGAPIINETAGNGEKPSDSKPSGTGGHEGAAPATHQSAGSEERPSDSKPNGAGLKTEEAPAIHEPSGDGEKPSDTKPTSAGGQDGGEQVAHQQSLKPGLKPSESGVDSDSSSHHQHNDTSQHPDHHNESSQHPDHHTGAPPAPQQSQEKPVESKTATNQGHSQDTKEPKERNQTVNGALKNTSLQSQEIGGTQTEAPVNAQELSTAKTGKDESKMESSQSPVTDNQQGKDSNNQQNLQSTESVPVKLKSPEAKNNTDNKLKPQKSKNISGVPKLDEGNNPSTPAASPMKGPMSTEVNSTTAPQGHNAPSMANVSSSKAVEIQAAVLGGILESSKVIERKKDANKAPEPVSEAPQAQSKIKDTGDSNLKETPSNPPIESSAGVNVKQQNSETVQPEGGQDMGTGTQQMQQAVAGSAQQVPVQQPIVQVQQQQQQQMAGMQQIPYGAGGSQNQYQEMNMQLQQLQEELQEQAQQQPKQQQYQSNAISNNAANTWDSEMMNQELQDPEYQPVAQYPVASQTTVPVSGSPSYSFTSVPANEAPETALQAMSGQQTYPAEQAQALPAKVPEVEESKGASGRTGASASSREDCSVNLGVVLDSKTTAYNEENSRKLLQFAKKVTHLFPVTPEGNRVGMMVYSGSPKLKVVHFDHFLDQQTMDKAIDSASYLNMEIKTGKVLNFAQEHLFSKIPAGKQNVLLLITDGVSYDDVTRPAIELKRRGVEIFCIGVGDNVVRKELETISSPPESDHVIMTSYNMMGATLEDIKQRICASAQKKEEIPTTNRMMHAGKCNKADVGFLIDGSRTVEVTGKGNFDKVVEFVKNVSLSFPLSPDYIRIGAVAYGSEPFLEIPFGSYNSTGGLLTYIDSIKYPGSSTKTGKALTFTRQNLFGSPKARRKVPKILVVLTGSSSSDDVREASEDLHRDGIHVVSVGLGPVYDRVQLRNMASFPNVDNVMDMDYPELYSGGQCNACQKRSKPLYRVDILHEDLEKKHNIARWQDAVLPRRRGHLYNVLAEMSD